MTEVKDPFTQAEIDALLKALDEHMYDYEDDLAVFESARAKLEAMRA